MADAWLSAYPSRTRRLRAAHPAIHDLFIIPGESMNLTCYPRPQSCEAQSTRPFHPQMVWRARPGGPRRLGLLASVLALAALLLPAAARADLTDFRLVGSFNGHTYYVSRNAMSWNSARTLCQGIPGGYLATISNATENAYVAGCDLDGTNTGLWIGLTDEGHEGTWSWVTGEAAGFTNWDLAYGQPDGGSSENVVSLKPTHMPNSPGKWHDQNADSVSLLCVLEVEPGCPSLSDFRFVGHYNGSAYYVSNAAMTWNAANALCQSIPGGNLASIADAAENAFVAGCDLDGTHTGLWIGLTDEGHEGSWQWVNGGSASYFNWEAGQPQGGTGENVVSMKPSHMPNGPGKWHDQNANSISLLCVLEIPGATPVQHRTWGWIKQLYK